MKDARLQKGDEWLPRAGKVGKKQGVFTMRVGFLFG